jgi:hypothetical protein
MGRRKARNRRFDPVVWETYISTFDLFKADAQGNPITITLSNWQNPMNSASALAPKFKKLRVLQTQVI